MPQDKKNITEEFITELLSSTGFLFPRNETELARFEKLYDDIDYGLTGTEIDPDKIINDDFHKEKKSELPKEIDINKFGEYKMAARNGKGLPKHIQDRILKNQNKSKDDTTASEKTDN